MISAANMETREHLVQQLMQTFSDKWACIVRSLTQGDPHQLFQDPQVLREISLILRVTERLVSAVGAACHKLLAGIYFDMLKIYKCCSDIISHSIAQQGTQIMG